MLLLLLTAAILGCDLLGILASIHARHAVRIRDRAPRCRPTLVMAVTGPSPGLEELFACLAAQTCRIRRLVVAVESTADPAYARVAALSGAQSYPVQVVVAGVAQAQGQKAHNLVAAVRSLVPTDDVVVFLDADIRPQPWWLATLARTVAKGTADAVSGYRWQTGPSDLGGAILAAIDRSLAIVPFREAGRIVWGGSIAVGRPALDRLDLPTLLAGTVSDDLTMGRTLYKGGFRVQQRPAALVPTPIGAVAGIRRNFLVRQYRIMLVHRPALVVLSATWLALRLGAWAGLLALAPAQPAALLPLLADVAAGLLKARERDGLARRLDVPDPPPVRRTQFLLALAPPLVDLYHVTGIMIAATSRRLRWAHVEYDLVARDETRIVARTGYGEIEPAFPAGPVAAPGAAPGGYAHP